LPQRGEEFVEVHGGVPFLLRCWLISSIGEDPTPARSYWAKEESRLHERCKRALIYIVKGPYPYLLEYSIGFPESICPH